MNLATIVLEQARLRPKAPAIIASHKGRDRIMTFGGLADASARVAEQLREVGLAPGSAMLLLVPMSPELYAVLVGLFRAGLVPTVLDPSAGRKHIDRCCELNPPAGFIGVPKAHMLRLLSGRIRDIPHKFCVGAGWPFGRRLQFTDGKSIDERVADLPSEHPALMTFTSGSTGLPKAVIRSHGFLLAQHQAIEHSIQLQAGQLDLTTLPVFVLANLGSGVASVIPDCDLRKPGQIEAAPVLAQVERLGITRTAASPAFIECLLQAPTARTAGAGFRQVFTGGAPVFPRLLQRVKEIWPACEPTAVYGSTEAEPIADLPFRDIDADDLLAMRSGRGLLAGKPVSEIKLAIIPNQWGQPIRLPSTDEFQSITLSPGVTGEIVVNGEHVLRGYLNGQGDAETKFQVDGATWHRTGDAGYLDQSGRLWLMGRCAARITDSIGELYPFAVECIAMQFEWVRLAGCVGVKGKRCLAVECRREPSAAEKEELRKALEAPQVSPVILRGKLPVDARHNAKIDYRRLALLLVQNGNAD